MRGERELAETGGHGHYRLWGPFQLGRKSTLRTRQQLRQRLEESCRVCAKYGARIALGDETPNERT